MDISEYQENGMKEGRGWDKRDITIINTITDYLYITYYLLSSGTKAGQNCDIM